MTESEAGALPLSAAERRWNLAAAISCVSVFGISVGFVIPLFSLLLEARGTETSLTGLNAAASYLGVVVGPLWTPRLVRWLGIRSFLLLYLALDILVFLLMKLFDGIAAWFLLRIALGFIGSSIFTASEAWINMLAGDASRGRIIGLYAASLSAGFAVGPLLLSIAGIEGSMPFILGATITGLAALPLLGVGNLTRGLGRERAGSALAMFARAPLLVVAVGFYGVFESSTFALMPIWGVRVGLDRGLAAITLSAIAAGSIALQFPIGWLSDKVPRRTVLQLCAIAGLVGAATIPFLAAGQPPFFAALLCWGGLAAGIYPVALAMAGERFRGSELVAVNAALIVAYGLGALAGPTLCGAAMDLWNPHGLLAALAVLFALFLAATLFPRRAGANKDRRRAF